MAGRLNDGADKPSNVMGNLHRKCVEKTYFQVRLHDVADNIDDVLDGKPT